MERKGRIYILPTGFGALFIFGAFLMILVGATYQNNLVNMLAFFMLSLIFIAMVQTHNNLKDVIVDKVDAENGYKGSQHVVTAMLTNSANDPRFNLEFSLRKKPADSVYENLQPLMPKGLLKLKAAYPAPTRGKFDLSEVRVHTAFPLGLFRAWTWLEVSSSYYVYPEPKGEFAFPPQSVVGDESAVVAQAVRGGEDFHGHRRYAAGDSLGHIDWKAKARGRPLLIKEFNEGAPSPITLDWYKLEGLGEEDRLSQLAKWIDEAVRKRAVFSLRLPAKTIAAGQGLQHSQKCLEALAVYKGGDSVRR